MIQFGQGDKYSNITENFKRPNTCEDGFIIQPPWKKNWVFENRLKTKLNQNQNEIDTDAAAGAAASAAASRETTVKTVVKPGAAAEAAAPGEAASVLISF